MLCRGNVLVAFPFHLVSGGGMTIHTSYRYTLHPVLAAFYEKWSELAGSCLPIYRTDQTISCMGLVLMFYREMQPSREPSAPVNRQIISPMLPVLYWDGPSAVPDDVRWFKTNFSDDDVISLLVTEWLHMIFLSKDPVLAEIGRRVFAHILDAQQCQRFFGVKMLSQRSWGKVTHLSREQLAHAATLIKGNTKKCESGKAIQAVNDSSLSFFKDIYG